jgi:hypothetical protein
VVHARESLAFGLKSFGENLVGGAGADELDGDQTLEGGGLFREPDLAHAACAELVQQPIWTDGTGNGESRIVTRGSIKSIESIGVSRGRRTCFQGF